MAQPNDAKRGEKERHTDEVEAGKDGVTAAPGRKDGITGEPGRTDGLIERRSYLKLVGAAAVAGSAAMGNATAQEDYDTITVPAGTIKRYDLGDGDTLRNKLFDISADGAAVKIVPSGSDWLVENIGLKGRFDAKTFFILPSADGGERGVVRNIYAKSYGVRGGGVLVQPGHSGEVVIENVWLEGFPNNGVYGSPPGSHGKNNGHNGEGRVVVRNSMGLNNNVAQFRTGSPNCLLENCVMKYDGNQPGDYPLNPSAGVRARGVWCRGYDLTIRDCDIDVPSHLAGAGEAVLAASNFTHPQDAVVTLENTRTNGQLKGGQNGRIVGESAGSPVDRVPEGCPTSPVEAASGGGSDSSTATWHDLVISDEGGWGQSNYEFAVSGDLEKTDGGSATIDDHDAMDGSSVAGHVWGGTDAYRFTGSLDEFWADGPVSVQLDGEDANPAELASDLPNHVVISDADRSEMATYELSVSGDLERSVDGGATIDDHDALDGASVAGHVWGGTDAYRFSGEIEDIQVDGDADVEVNGEPMDV